MDPQSIAIRSIQIMANGSLADFEELVAPHGFTRERKAAPPNARGTGPAGMYELALWLRGAIDDLAYEIHHAVADGDLVAVNSTMSGRHVRPVAFFTEDGRVDAAFPPTGKSFAITQSHWFRIEHDLIVEHWANRDDLGMAKQLGWVPPTPVYLFRMARAKRAAERALR